MSSKTLPPHWNLRPLSEVVDALIDYRGKTPKKSESGIPLVTAKIVKGGVILPATEFIAESDYDSWMVRGRPEVGDVVVTTEAPLGEVAQIKNNNIALAQRIVTLRGAKDTLLSDYLLYLMQSSFIKEQLEARSSGSTVKGVKQSELRKILLPIPPVHEQEWIGRQLKSIDNKIQLNHQINHTLEQMAQALFKSWFVDFEPVKAKIAARECWQALLQEDEPASPVCYAVDLDEPPALGDLESYMNRAAMQAISGKTADKLDALREEDPERYDELYETAALFPSAMQASELGEIPEGWKPSAISEVAEVIKGKSYKSAELSSSKTALVTLKSFNRGGGYRLDGLKEYTGNYKASQEVVSGDLVVAYTDVTQAADVIGKPAMIIGDDNYEHLVISLDVAVVRPFDGFMKVFLYGLTRTESFQAHTESHTTGTTVLHLSKSAVPGYKFALPLEALLMAYKKQVSPLFSLIDNNVQEGRNLSKLRDTLLPKLLSGELTVPAAEARMAEVADA